MCILKQLKRREVMSEFKKYPSISKFSEVLKTVNKNNKRTFSHVDIAEDGTKSPVFNYALLPKLKFRGTVKLHGTSAAVILNSDFTVEAQSRNRVLSLTSDNHGFCNWLVGKSDVFIKAYEEYLQDLNIFSLHIYGEWCGSNIQSNVGLTGIDKTFVIFGILQTNVDDSEIWLSPEDINYLSDKDNSIRNIYEFETYDIEIDMNDPKEGLTLADNLRDAIDLECPVAKALSSTAECTHGEGNVWRCVTEDYTSLAFKHKGESHTRSGKLPRQQKLDTPLTEDQSLSYENFLKEACTVDRMSQGIEFLQENNLELHQKNTGVYLKWFFADVQKECKDEITVLCKDGLDWKKVSKPLSEMAREFLFSEIGK